MPPRFKNLTVVCIITILLHGFFYIRSSSPSWTVSVTKSSALHENVLSFQSGPRNHHHKNDSLSDSVYSLDTNYSIHYNNSTKQDKESAIIFNTNRRPDFHLEQNDPRLLKYISDHHLWAPLPLPYNLDKPFEDPTWREGQNKVVLKLLENKRNGIFIEAGANNGEFLSNTLALERDYGWTGILVEPDRKAFKELRGKNRKAWLSDVCLSVSSSPQKVTFLQYKLTSTWSKIANVSDHSKKWNKDEMEEVEVECIPFYSLVLALNMTSIDYFSLDIEGAELQILKTIPFDKVLIRTLSIEYDHIRLVPGADEELKHLMESNGFTLVTRVHQGYAKDYIYAHDSLLQN